MNQKVILQIRSEAEDIFKSCLHAVDPYQAVKRFVNLKGDRLCLGAVEESKTELDMKKYDRISIVGGGKATAPMARSVEDLLGKRFYKGIINVKYGFKSSDFDQRNHDL